MIDNTLCDLFLNADLLPMTTRRQLVKFLLLYGAFYSAVKSRLVSGVSLPWAKTGKRIVEPGTPLSSLIIRLFQHPIVFRL